MWAKLLLKTWCTVIIFNTLHFFCFNLVDLPLFYLLIDATIIGLRSEVAKLLSSTEELDHMRHFKEEYEKIDKENIRYFPLRGYRSQKGVGRGTCCSHGDLPPIWTFCIFKSQATHWMPNATHRKHSLKKMASPRNCIRNYGKYCMLTYLLAFCRLKQKVAEMQKFRQQCADLEHKVGSFLEEKEQFEKEVF